MDIPQAQMEPLQSAEILPVGSALVHETCGDSVAQRDPTPQDFTNEVQTINGIPDGLKAENDALKNRLALAEKENQKLREEIAALKGNKQKFPQNNDELNEGVKVMKGRLLNLTGELQSVLESGNSELTKNLEGWKTQQKLYEQVTKLMEQVHCSGVKVCLLQDDNNALKEKVGELETEKKLQENKIEKLTNEKNILQYNLGISRILFKKLRDENGLEASSQKKFPNTFAMKRRVISVHRTNLTLLRLVGTVRKEMSEVAESNQTIWKMYVRKVVELDFAKEKIASLEESSQVVQMEADANADGDGDSDGDPQIGT